MKKLTLSLIVAVVFMNGCFFLPGEKEVTLKCEGLSYSFYCSEEVLNNYIRVMRLDHPNIKESDNVYRIKDCNVRMKHSSMRLEIRGAMLQTPFCVWERNHIGATCTKIEYAVIKKRLGGRTAFNNVSVVMEVN